MHRKPADTASILACTVFLKKIGQKIFLKSGGSVWPKRRKFLCPIFLRNTVHGFALQKTLPLTLGLVRAKTRQNDFRGWEAGGGFGTRVRHTVFYGSGIGFSLVFQKAVSQLSPFRKHYQSQGVWGRPESLPWGEAAWWFWTTPATG